VLRVTGLSSLEQFLSIWTEAEQKNFTLYSRVDGLLEEGEELRSQITDLRVRAASSCLRQDVENRPRRNVLEGLKAKLAATRDKAERQRHLAEQEAASVTSVKKGLRSLLETMEGEETEDLLDGGLMDYFGIVEQSMREVLVWHVQHGQQPAVSPIAAETGSSAARSSTKELPSAFTVAVGPSESTGTLTRNIVSSVSAPSIEGPRAGDTRQSEAFKQPFLATATTDFEDEGFDRPIIVPSPASRNMSRSMTMSATFPPPSTLDDDSAFSLPAVRPSSRPNTADEPSAKAAEADTPLPRLV